MGYVAILSREGGGRRGGRRERERGEEGEGEGGGGRVSCNKFFCVVSIISKIVFPFLNQIRRMLCSNNILNY